LPESGPEVTLFRPVGQGELDLIEATQWQAFPPRLDHQPIFYRVLTEEYATKIARDWNTKDTTSGSSGTYRDLPSLTPRSTAGHRSKARPVMRFGNGGSAPKNSRIFNAMIIGAIEVVAEYR
jgi:hypothetical protein